MNLNAKASRGPRAKYIPTNCGQSGRLFGLTLSPEKFFRVCFWQIKVLIYLIKTLIHITICMFIHVIILVLLKGFLLPLLSHKIDLQGQCDNFYIYLSVVTKIDGSGPV